MNGRRKARLKKHIDTLLREHDITATYDSGRGHASVPKREISIPPIEEEMDYFISLHEIGHVVIGLKGRTRLEREAHAWTWAFDNTLIEVQYPERQRICALLVRYWFKAKSKGWKVPEAGEFWDHMQWW